MTFFADDGQQLSDKIGVGSCPTFGYCTVREITVPLYPEIINDKIKMNCCGRYCERKAFCNGKCGSCTKAQ